ncbi:MAG: DUF3990 domain-containing protein [Lachnospiraceae bacterium]|nr:DUF3990 domain-containing protein [Lachnospiraceae bacterium]
MLYHASKEIVEFPEVRKTRYTKDFSWGFYCTNHFEQAVRWANRGVGEPIINYYSYEPVDGLSVLKFDNMTDEWLDFIAKCRSGKTHQISFHTLSALNCLKFDRSEIVYDRKGKK